jgi:phage shock protein PspC (stress-responsive transcriptional regulator)
MQDMASTELPAPTSRPRRGRWLGGVCAGLAARWSLPVARVRAAFALGTLVLGLGALLYVAGWLILPAEGEDGAAPGPRGIVLLAQATGALVALATLAAAAAAATVFGFGWAVVAVGAAVLAGTLLGWPRVGPGWALLPIGALALPSVALAAGGLRVDPHGATVEIAPRTAAELPRTLHSGLGLLQVDLRHTALPRSGTIALRIDAGLRRTLVALPHDRCVHVEVVQHPLPVASRVAAVLLGAGYLSTPGVRLFGDPRNETRATPPPLPHRVGPTLRVDFSSAGGELVVRDYPDGVDPAVEPDWPGYLVDVYDPRPDTSGRSSAGARRAIRRWRAQRRERVREERALARRIAGPCAKPARKPASDGKRAAGSQNQAKRPGAHGAKRRGERSR